VTLVTFKKFVATVDNQSVSNRRNPQQIGQTWVLVSIVVGLLALSAMLTYVAGGTKTPLPHAFYIPIVVAAGGFGLRAGAATAAVAGVLCGPWMPLNVEDGLSQTTSRWIIRLGFFLTIAVVVGFGRNRLLKLSRARQNFLSVVSHELRTPLASVMGFAALLANRDLTLTVEEHAEFADLILKEANELTNVVDHYVVEGRLSDSALFIDAHPTDLRKIVDIVIGGLPDQIRERRVEVAGSEITCMADPLRLRQILRSMFNNALSYSPNRILVDVTTDRTSARVTVSDRDNPASATQRLSPWTHVVHKDKAPVFPPLGIGLAVSRDLAKRMGGELSYEVNGTTRFELRLPLDNTRPRRHPTIV
jgi:signal transduction histidine kinase